LLALATVEVGLRLLAPVPDPYEAWKPRTAVNQFIRSEMRPLERFTTEVEPGLPGMAGRGVFTTNALGFRGGALERGPRSAGETRVFLLGGSTAECFYLDDALAVNAVLEEGLPPGTRVYGAGKSGDASDDHVSLLVHRIVHLEPAVVIVLAGVNDLLLALHGADPLHFVHGEARHTFRLQAKLLATEFQIPRRLYALDARSENQLLEDIPFRSNYREKALLCAAAPAAEEPPPPDTNAFRANLRTIAGVARAHGVKLVLATQPSTWGVALPEWHWMLLVGHRRLGEAWMARALATFNAVTCAVAAEQGVPVLDLAGSMPAACFYDDVHWNVAGARAAGTALAGFMVEQGVVKR
jgi:lysophospholipase L1-like esterase